MLSYIAFYILAAVLLFQGLHIFRETTEPLGTLPEETAQSSKASRVWGVILMTWAIVCLIVGLTGHAKPAFAEAVRPMLKLSALLGILFGLWVVFRGRTIEFMGKPSADDDHGHASGH